MNLLAVIWDWLFSPSRRRRIVRTYRVGAIVSKRKLRRYLADAIVSKRAVLYHKLGAVILRRSVASAGIDSVVDDHSRWGKFPWGNVRWT